MSADAPHLVTRWRVEGTAGEVADIVGDPLSWPRWWPSACLEAQGLQPPDAHGLGARVHLLTKGWLPWTLGCDLTIVESSYPRAFTVLMSGDLAGRATWSFEQDGPWVNVTCDWRARAGRPPLRVLSPLVRWFSVANCRWTMAQGEASLVLELARRRADSVARRRVPPPPGPVTYAGALVLAGVVAVCAGLGYLMYRAARRAPSEGPPPASEP
jgi:hypothetical protein